MIIDENESSKRIISAASLAISVPLFPIANPTCAVLSAGASFVPSPVTATILLVFFNPKTRRNLSSGEALAIIFNLDTVFLNFSISLSSIITLSCSFFDVNPPERTLNSFPLNAIGHVISVLLNVVLRREVFFSLIFFDSMISSSVMIPASLDIAIAVKRLSPVTILTVIPALLHVAIEDGTSVRRGSVIPIMN